MNGKNRNEGVRSGKIGKIGEEKREGYVFTGLEKEEIWKLGGRKRRDLEITGVEKERSRK